MRYTFPLKGRPKNKLPVWAYMKETIRKKKRCADRKTSCGGFFHQGANLLRQARFKNLRQPASVFLEIDSFLRLSQFLKSECPNRQFIFRPPLSRVFRGPSHRCRTCPPDGWCPAYANTPVSRTSSCRYDEGFGLSGPSALALRRFQKESAEGTRMAAR